MTPTLHQVLPCSLVAGCFCPYGEVRAGYHQLHEPHPMWFFSSCFVALLCFIFVLYMYPYRLALLITELHVFCFFLVFAKKTTHKHLDFPARLPSLSQPKSRAVTILMNICYIHCLAKEVHTMLILHCRFSFKNMIVFSCFCYLQVTKKVIAR